MLIKSTSTSLGFFFLPIFTTIKLQQINLEYQSVYSHILVSYFSRLLSFFWSFFFTALLQNQESKLYILVREYQSGQEYQNLFKCLIIILLKYKNNILLSYHLANQICGQEYQIFLKILLSVYKNIRMTLFFCLNIRTTFFHITNQDRRYVL